MRFLVLGGTGPSGIELIRKAFAVYPDAQVVVYARSPEKLPEDLIANPALTTAKGLLEELDKVDAALEGVNVVVSALGPSGSLPPGSTDDTPITTFYKNLIPLMRVRGITRLIALATASFPDDNDKTSLKYALLVRSIKLFFNTAYREIVGIGTVVTTDGADLEWTLARVPFLTNAHTDAVAAGYVGDKEIGISLSRKAFAAFVIGEVGKKEWVRKAPMLSNP